MSDGKKFYSDLIISGTGVFQTYNHLITKDISVKHGFVNNLKKVTPSVAHGCLYLGLNGTSEELQLPKNNLWIYPDNIDHDTAVENYLNDNDSDFPLVYISFASSKDPTWQSQISWQKYHRYNYITALRKIYEMGGYQVDEKRRRL